MQEEKVTDPKIHVETPEAIVLSEVDADKANDANDAADNNDNASPENHGGNGKEDDCVVVPSMKEADSPEAESPVAVTSAEEGDSLPKKAGERRWGM